jgi:REP element-mobilizing transposase RayT
MKPICDSRIHHRRSIRLHGFDYRSTGAYFVTICTHERACYFGNIEQHEAQLNEWCDIANQCWYAIPEHFPYIELDEFIIMPNHIHGILWITDARAQYIAPQPDVRAQYIAPQPNASFPNAPSDIAPQPDVRAQYIAPQPNAPLPNAPSDIAPQPDVRAQYIAPQPIPNVMPKSLSAIVRAYKAAVTKRIREMTHQPDAKIWQRNFYEHIIRNDTDLERIRAYIRHNPQRWQEQYGELDDDNQHPNITETLKTWRT